MSSRFAGLALATFVGFASPVIAADQDWDACKQSVQDWDKEIAGCSAVLSRSRTTNGDRAFALNNRGFAYDVKGDHDRAIADYNEAIRLKPDYAAVFNNRGFVYDKMGDHDRAIADYNEAIRLKPDLANAFNNRGRHLRGQRRPRQGDRGLRPSGSPQTGLRHCLQESRIGL